MSWNDAQDFIKKLNQQTGKKFRLPTESEWEFAARGGNRSNGYTYSGANEISSVGWFSENSHDFAARPVGGKSANELGIYDMTGNVWEWCNDWYGTYSYNFARNPKGPASGASRVVRGGGMNFFGGASNCRVSIRYKRDMNYSQIGTGFRLAISPSN